MLSIVQVKASLKKTAEIVSLLVQHKIQDSHTFIEKLTYLDKLKAAQKDVVDAKVNTTVSTNKLD